MNRDRVEWGRNYRQTEAYKEKSRQSSKTYRINNPDKVKENDRKTNQRRFGDSSRYFKRLFTHAKSRAKRLGKEWTIEFKDLELPKVCPVFGIELDISKDATYDNKPSLDRIDNSKGYIKGNVHIISKRANRIKSDATAKELLQLSQYAARNNF